MLTSWILIYARPQLYLYGQTKLPLTYVITLGLRFSLVTTQSDIDTAGR